MNISVKLFQKLTGRSREEELRNFFMSLLCKYSPPKEPCFFSNTSQLCEQFLKKGNPVNISVKLFQNVTSSSREEDLKKISSRPYAANIPYHQSHVPFLTEYNFACEIILKSDHWFQRRRFLKISLKIQFPCHVNHSL